MDTDQLAIRYDYYLHAASTWSAVLTELGLAEVYSITDYLSGWSPKLTLALINTDFHGTLTAIDRSADSLATYQRLADPLVKEFKLRYLAMDILQSPLPLSDLIIANHSLEDLILFQHLAQNGNSANPYNTPQDFISFWQTLVMHPPDLESLARQLATSFSQALSPKGTLIITQYPGYQEKLYNLEIPYRLSLQLLSLLSVNLAGYGYYPDPKLSRQVLRFVKDPYFSVEHMHIFTS